MIILSALHAHSCCCGHRCDCNYRC
jgi:hypothetical protein